MKPASQCDGQLSLMLEVCSDVPVRVAAVKPTKPTPKSQAAEILKMLQSGHEVSNMFMAASGVLKYTGRISDLRKRGYKITCRQEKGGLWLYKLVQP